MAIPTLETPDPFRLNIGAGNKEHEGWTSLGFEAHHDIRSDIRDMPMIDNDTVDEAMAIHVLEHLERWDAPAALAEWYRILKPGGLLTLELPELTRCARAVLERDPEGPGVQGLFGDPSMREPLMMHRWCWSEEELIRTLRQVGFIKVRLGELRYHGRRRWRDMHIEARKPETPA